MAWLRYLGRGLWVAGCALLLTPIVAYPRAMLGPSDKISALRAQPNETYTFVVRWSPGASLSEILPAGTDLSGATDLPLITGAALPLKVGNALALADNPRVVQVWYLHPDLAPLYLNVIQGLDKAVRTLELPTIVNLSLGPPVRFWPEVAQPDDPLHVATRAAAEAGLIPIMAIGNSGDGPGNRAGKINPWSQAPWVLRVGAYDGAKGRVASFSSRGHPSEPATWPDGVAQGVDVIGPYPTNLTKSDARRQRDEGHPAFLAQVPPEKRHLYTLESGTSQAAAQVTRAASQLLFFLRETIRRRSDSSQGPLFQLTAPPDRANPALAAMPRLTGTVETQPDGSLVFTYSVDEPWKMVIQGLRDTALPLAGVPPEEGGAGLIDPSSIEIQFGAFGSVSPKIFPIKVIE